MNEELETISCNPNQIIHQLNDCSINESLTTDAKMIVSPLNGNGFVQREDTTITSYKTPVNGFINSSNNNNISNGSTNSTNSSVSNSSDTQSSMHSIQQSSQTSPFPLLSGETVLYSGSTTEGAIILTNFRLFISFNKTKDVGLPISLPIGVIETVEFRDLYYLYIYTKHVRSFICSFASGDECSLWYKRLIDICSLQSKFDNLFCFKFFNATKSDNKMSNAFNESKHIRNCHEFLSKEFKRMAFESNKWRICDINKDFKLCESYPKYLIVPHNVNDKDLESVANFRYSRRIPTAVWRHRKNGCVITRSSQPEVGWLGWRNNQDEHLIQSIVASCSDENSYKKLLILDARSYTAAVANRAKGGGCECPEYYLNSEVQFMSLANIHSIRKSFHSLRYICESPADQFNWLTLLDNSKWLHNISALMKSALIVVNAIDLEERPVLVHCSDGWDRTPQIVALAELMLDPFYRTIDGFKALVEREWIQFGHKFADRCGHGASSDDTNERCPVFLQWLDCVHQLVKQFPCSFEFNPHFLIKITQHTYSCLFGTFISNNMLDRFDHQLHERSFSVWAYINSRRQQFLNYAYIQNEQVLRPSCKAKDIVFWSDVYMPLSSSICGTFLSTCCPDTALNMSIISNSNTNGDICRNGILKDSEIDLKQNETSASNNETESDMDTIASDKHHSLLSKTRSCENIALDDDNYMCSNENTILRTRHCSDPNLFRSLTIADQIEWEKGKCADILKYIQDLQTNGSAINREYCDRDSNHVPLCRDSENGMFDETDGGMSAHFTMLSTETLLNGNNSSCVENIQPLCDNQNILNNFLTTSTSTTELSNSSVQNNDLTVQFDKLYHSVYSQKKKQTQNGPIQRQGSNEVNNCNGNGKHTRTPSSGCPATPNDDQLLDALPCDGALNQDIFDIDGHVLIRDKPLIRLQQIMTQNKNEIEYLRKELYMARLALCQQLKFCNGYNDENSVSNATHSSDNNVENQSLDSWVDVMMPSLQPNSNGFAYNAKCDKTNSSLFSEVNNSTCDHSLNSVSHCDQFSLNHI